MWNAHASWAADQILEDGVMIHENGDEAKAEGCGGHESVRRYGVQLGREVGRKDY